MNGLQSYQNLDKGYDNGEFPFPYLNEKLFRGSLASCSWENTALYVQMF